MSKKCRGRRCPRWRKGWCSPHGEEGCPAQREIDALRFELGTSGPRPARPQLSARWTLQGGNGKPQHRAQLVQATPVGARRLPPTAADLWPPTRPSCRHDAARDAATRENVIRAVVRVVNCVCLNLSPRCSAPCGCRCPLAVFELAAPRRPSWSLSSLPAVQPVRAAEAGDGRHVGIAATELPRRQLPSGVVCRRRRRRGS